MTNQHDLVPNDDFVPLLTLWQSRSICSMATVLALLLAFFSIAPDFFGQSHAVLLGWILITTLAWLRGLAMDTALNHELPKRHCQSVAALFDLVVCLTLFATFALIAMPLIGIYLLAVLLYPARPRHPLNDDALKDTAIGQWLTILAIVLLAAVCTRFAGFFLMLLPIAMVSWRAQQHPVPYRYSGGIGTLLLPLMVMFAGVDTALITYHYTFCALTVLMGVLISDKGARAAHFSLRRHFWTMLLAPQVVALLFDTIDILAAWTEG